jgi:glycosyltransferase involved in cell wall biosynthesis
LRDSDLVVVNGLEMTLRLCKLFTVAPFLQRPLVAVDVVLRKPDSARRLLNALVTRRLLKQVDYFLHYFRDLHGYEKYFGVTPERSGYVPFKPNLRHRAEINPNADGEYVLCIGQSVRDYETFFDAVSGLPCPAAIPAPDFRELRRHRSRFTRGLGGVPTNVRVLEDDKSEECLLRIVSGARLVVLPILRSSLCASGIGMYLNSMLLGKCVVLSRGPGASDVLTDQAIMVEPEDPDALARAIRCAWDDDILRKKTAAAGYAYAISLGGEPELCDRVLAMAVHWYAERVRHREPLMVTRYN